MRQGELGEETGAVEVESGPAIGAQIPATFIPAGRNDSFPKSGGHVDGRPGGGGLGRVVGHAAHEAGVEGGGEAETISVIDLPECGDDGTGAAVVEGGRQAEQVIAFEARGAAAVAAHGEDEGGRAEGRVEDVVGGVLVGGGAGRVAEDEVVLQRVGGVEADLAVNVYAA